MMDLVDIRIEEYRSLMEEHQKNRSYIFERPIIILGALAITIQYFYESAIGLFVLAGLIFILLFNLWFIGNRIKSDARIIAYIGLVHEGDLRRKYFGWENALRHYRIWMSKNKKIGDLEKIRSKRLNPEVPDIFLPVGIWLLHIFLVILIFIVAFARWYTSETVLISLGMAVISLATLIFMFFVLWVYSPKKLRVSIELERATWLCIFEEIINDDSTDSSGLQDIS